MQVSDEGADGDVVLHHRLLVLLHRALLVLGGAVVCWPGFNLMKNVVFLNQ